MNYKISCFDKELYHNHSNARLVGELHTTPSKIDATESRTGVLDFIETTEMFEKLTGMNGLSYGIVSGVQFIDFYQIREAFQDKNINNTEEALSSIIEKIKNSDFTVSVKSILGDEAIILQDVIDGKVQELDDNVKMNFIKQISKSILNDGSIKEKFEDELKCIRDELKKIQDKEYGELLESGY